MLSCCCASAARSQCRRSSPFGVHYLSRPILVLPSPHNGVRSELLAFPDALSRLEPKEVERVLQPTCAALGASGRCFVQSLPKISHSFVFSEQQCELWTLSDAARARGNTGCRAW